MPFVAPIVAGVAAASAVSSAIAVPTIASIALATTAVAGAAATVAGAVTHNTTLETIGGVAAAGGALGASLAASSAAPSVAESVAKGLPENVAGGGAAVGQLPGNVATTSEIGTAVQAAGTFTKAAAPVTGLFGSVEQAAAVVVPGAGSPIATIGDVLASIGNVAESLANDIKQFTQPIVDVVNETTSVFRAIQDNVISPINNFIGAAQTLTTQLPQEFEALGREGLKGLGEFVTSVADTLTSADAQFGRAVQQLGENNLGTARDVLVPGLTEGIGTPLGNLSTSWRETISGSYKSPATFGHVDLASPPHAAEIMQQVDAVEKSLSSGNELWRLLANAFLDLIKIAPAIERINAPSLNEIEQAVSAAVPTELLSLSDLIRGYYRGILDRGEVNAEALKQGLDPTRVQTLIENALWLPGAREAVEFFYRGGLDESTLERVLEQIGLTSTFAQAVKIAMLEPIDPRESMAATGRLNMGARGFLTSAYATPPPEAFLALYPPRFADPKRAAVDWLQHWRTPGLSWWITAYFRGLRTLTEVEMAAQAENVPAEVIPDLIAVEQDVVQLWMIPDMLATNIFTEAEALDYLKYIGIGDRSAQVIVQYGNAKKKAPAAAQAGDLAGISAANAATMFDDGLITRDQYVEILEAHKYAPDAAQLTVALAEQKNAIAARKTQATDIVNEVNAGLITEADGLSALYSLGYTDAEVAGYVLKIKQAKTAAAKKLSDADLKALWKHDLIADLDASNGLLNNGWSQANATLLLNLWKAGG